MVFRYFRERIFSFAGAYTLVVFYNNAQNELSDPVTGHAIPTKLKINPPKPSESQNILYGLVPSFLGNYGEQKRLMSKPVARPSDDLQYAVVEYDVQTAIAMGMLILAGGWFAIGGATAALVMECSADGPQTYDDLKHAIFKARKEIEV